MTATTDRNVLLTWRNGAVRIDTDLPEWAETAAPGTHTDFIQGAEVVIRISGDTDIDRLAAELVTPLAECYDDDRKTQTARLLSTLRALELI